MSHANGARRRRGAVASVSGSPRGEAPRIRLESLAAIAVFAVLVAAMTWPQALHLSSHATQHQDIYFNMWRLAWFAHALATSPSRLFDANIFYPEPRTLALSDAMIVEGVAAAPLLWTGMNPILVHNIMLLGAIVLSGAAMYALVRYLTGSRGAGLLAGIVFAFAPYRVEHIMHPAPLVGQVLLVLAQGPTGFR